MLIIPPVAVTSTNLISSNIAEDEYDVYAGGTTYAVGDNVIYDHATYEGLTASNVGNQPDTSPTNWLRLGATNRFKAFDLLLSDQASRAESITYEIDHGGLAVSSVAIFNLDAVSVRIQVEDDNEGAVYDETISLIDTTDVIDWETYFFAPVGFTKPDIFVNDIPLYGTAETTITITNTGGTAKVGQVVLGRSEKLGVSVFGTTLTIEDYSRKDRDAFGNAIIVERAFAKVVDYDVGLITEDVDRVQNVLAGYRTTPLVWLATDDAKFGASVYGYYRRFDITLSGPAISTASIEVEGLT